MRYLENKKKGKKEKMSGEHWRSRLYRRLIGPICQFVASTKQATPLSNPIPAPDIAVTIDLPSKVREFSKGTTLNQSHLRGGTSRFENRAFQSRWDLRFVLLFIIPLIFLPLVTRFTKLFWNFRQNCVALFNFLIIKYLEYLRNNRIKDLHI